MQFFNSVAIVTMWFKLGLPWYGLVIIFLIALVIEFAKDSKKGGAA